MSNIVIFVDNLLCNHKMKYQGSYLDFTDERNAELMRAYRREIAKVRHINLHDIACKVVESAAPRFWVSPSRAMVVCSQLQRGIPVLEAMRPTKREMFAEIYRRVQRLREKHPDWLLIDLCAEVVMSPAPKHYMEPSSALERLFKIRNGWYDRRSGKADSGE